MDEKVTELMLDLCKERNITPNEFVRKFLYMENFISENEKAMKILNEASNHLKEKNNG